MKMVTAAAILLMVLCSALSLSVATSLLSPPLRRYHQRVESFHAFVAHPTSLGRWRGCSLRQESSSSSRRWSTAANDGKSKCINTDSGNGGDGGQYRYAISTTAIVQRRIGDAKRRRELQQQVLNNDRARNGKLRQLFHEENYSNSNNDNDDDDVAKRKDNNQRHVSNMFAVKVVACRTLREELKMTGREKRGRIFVERPLSLENNSNNNNNIRNDDIDDNNIDDAADHACTSMSGLKRTIHEFFRRLKKSSYLLSASLPTLDTEGNVLGGYSDEEEDAILSSKGGTWKLTSDTDVRRAFIQAEQYYFDNPIIHRPTLVIYVTKDPNATNTTNPLPYYLINMSDPITSSTMSMTSFYSFPPGGIADPEATADILRRVWRPFKALGRVYVANEGINAQMAVPTNVLSNFLKCCAIPSSSISFIEANVASGGGDGSATTNVEVNGELSKVLGVHIENGINVDPIPVDTATFFTNDPPFRNLHIRVRAQIVADGRLEKPLNWQNAGYDMPPLEWHRKLKEAKQAREERLPSGDVNNTMSSSLTKQQLPIVLDCRNDYETQVGKFDMAEPLGTTNFRDSWDVLKDRLKDTPKDSPIMTYCTGGIRCVKVNAYLTQELQFTNISRLAGGIVAYDRILREQAPDEESMFKGVNFVFDGRLGRKVTDDQLGTCYTCGEKTNMILNCKNDNCHRRMVQCAVCSGTFHNTCSGACKTRIVRMRYNRISGRAFAADEDGDKGKDTNGGTIYSNLDDYSVSHSTELPPLFQQIESNTQRLLPTGAHMVSGPVQGSLLTTLASMSRGGRVLEIGTFTGYATACFLLGAAQAGESLGVTAAGTRNCDGPFVLSLERDRSALAVAMAHLNVMTKYGIGDVGAAKLGDIGPDVKESFTGNSATFVYTDVAGCELLQVNDALATVEEMSLCHPSEAAFDIVYIDADKTRLIDYVNALLGNDRVLKKGGLILVDNVLWKGLVLDAAANGNGYDLGSDSDEHSEDEESLKKNRRARKLANKMHRFNSAVVRDSRVNVLMMNMRDGLSVIRKQ